MNKPEAFNFSDFTRSNYSNIIRIGKNIFHFSTYTNFVPNNRFVIWRHDVDISMHSAVKLAEIEANHNVSATYFIYTHSPFYNLLEKDIYECVKKILSLGHNIGIHFDSEFYGELNLSSFNYWLNYEATLLESYFNAPIKAFSFHNTTPFAISCKDYEYSGLINATSTYFREEVEYCSDSNGYWRYRRLEDVLQNPQVQRLQVLTHPEWWQEEIMSPRKRILRCIDGRANKTIKLYDNLLREFNRENVD